MRHALLVLVLLLAVCTGCLAPEDPSTAPTVSTPTENPPPTASSHIPDLRSTGAPCDDSLWVSFWGLPDQWEQDQVRVGYSAPPNTSLLLAAYVDGAVRGVAVENNTQSFGLVVDGAPIDLDSSLSGTHDVRVVVFRDADGDRRLEQDSDTPCLVDGELVQAGPQQVDFDEVG